MDTTYTRRDFLETNLLAAGAVLLDAAEGEGADASHGTFGTAVNCIDGRTQLPVIHWMQKEGHVDHVDMITVPGVDKKLSHEKAVQEFVRENIRISVEGHKSKLVVIVGHADCLGNPVSEARHIEDIRKSMDIVRSWKFPAEVTGLFAHPPKNGGRHWSVRSVERGK